MTIHTSFRQGHRVLVILTDGAHFVAKFKEAKSGRLIFLDHEDADLAGVRPATIYRGSNRREDD